MWLMVEVGAVTGEKALHNGEAQAKTEGPRRYYAPHATGKQELLKK